MAQFQRKTHRTRRLLDAVAHAYPQAWAQIDAFRRDRGRDPDFDWPDWCFMPIAAGYAIASDGGNNRVSFADSDHPAIITAMATWRMTQGIYRFDPTLIDAVLETPIDGDIPLEHLQRLPEWCVYVDLEGAGIPNVHGAWLHMEYDIARGGAPEFRVILDSATDPRQPFGPNGLRNLALPIIGSIDASLNKLIGSAASTAGLYGVSLPIADTANIKSAHDTIRPFLALALYLCSDADITQRGNAGAPHKPTPKRDRNGQWTLYPAPGPREWDVGVRIGAALRAAYQREQTGGSAAATGKHVRPHIRRAHWHTIVSGPRQDNEGTPIAAIDRRRELRWLPPIPINVDDLDALPATIRPVRNPSP